MLIEKEVIRPGTYFYKDEESGLPRKLVVTPELTKYWHEQGSKMLGFGLPIPVPYEHDFSAHPMTPKEKLMNNAGEVKEYRMKGDQLWSVLDIRDPDVKKKIGHSIRWTSPWISSFPDGDGREWKNVISHLALTTRPRIVGQEPFGSISAALSMATPVGFNQELFTKSAALEFDKVGAKGFCLSRAGRIFVGKKTNRLRPRYPIAFSLWGGGIKFGEDDMPPPKKKKDKSDRPAAGKAPDEDPFDGDLPDAESDSDIPGADAGAGADAGSKGNSPSADAAADDMSGIMDPMKDANSDVKMEELLCDLLQALGVPMPDASNEVEFKRHLYEAVMSKIKELTSKGMGDQGMNSPDQNKPPDQQPNASQPTNPIIQQEQQPMYMSLEEINKLPDPMKGVAMAMYTENQSLRAKMEANEKVANSLRDAKLKDAKVARDGRIALLGKLSPKVKADLDTMVALPSMALSLGDGGAVIDPMENTLTILEKGFGDLPRLLTTDQAALSVARHPTDAETLTREQENELVDRMAQQMGCPPEKKAG